MPTQNQIRKFAEDIIDAWDQDQLLEFAIEDMEDQLICMKNDEFIEEWETFYNKTFKEE